ncbi:hypothetical protein SAMN05660443_2064 [Marinospirillum celere]|uniref:Uncharacterized protein n=1 Tax=Marinospirillum celere TaxID=1122252 RepID=A0A1I1HW68_9GAMM|nr:hypothetical protein SAMN05660443_2064 [Marinospirillum celere]
MLAGCLDSDSSSGSNGGSGLNSGNLTGGSVEAARDLITIDAENVPAIFKAATEALGIVDDEARYLTQNLADDAAYDLMWADDYLDDKSSGEQACDGGGSYTFSITGEYVADYDLSDMDLGRNTQTFTNCDLDGFYIDSDILNGGFVYDLQEEGDGHLETFAFDDLAVTDESDDTLTHTYNGALKIKRDAGGDLESLSAKAFSIDRKEGDDESWLRIHDLTWSGWDDSRLGSLLQGSPDMIVDLHELDGAFELLVDDALTSRFIGMTKGKLKLTGAGDLSIHIEVTGTDEVTVALHGADGNEIEGCTVTGHGIDDELELPDGCSID